MQSTAPPSAIILAAGYSSRMGEFKPLLELGGLAAIDRVIDIYRTVGLTDIHVVTGFRSTAIQAAVDSRRVHLVYNADHDVGMFSSVLAGVAALPDKAPAFFVHPVDIPLVRAHTLSLLLAAGRIHSPAIVYPTFNDRRGHPPLIRGDLRKAIRAHNGDGGLRTLLDRFDEDAREIPVADNGVVLDMDTPDDYARLVNRSDRSAILNDDECRALMEKIKRLPAKITDHCRQVACVAVRLGEALNTVGATLDIPCIRSAALVHDVCRLEKNHATAGADLLTQMGFPHLADIVGVHMHIEVDDQAPIDEAQVVHLADKLVAGSTIVSLAERFDATHKKYGHDPIVAATIERRRQAALAIQAKIERATARSIGALVTAGSGGAQ